MLMKWISILNIQIEQKKPIVEQCWRNHSNVVIQWGVVGQAILSLGSLLLVLTLKVTLNPMLFGCACTGLRERERVLTGVVGVSCSVSLAGGREAEGERAGRGNPPWASWSSYGRRQSNWGTRSEWDDCVYTCIDSVFVCLFVCFNVLTVSLQVHLWCWTDTRHKLSMSQVLFWSVSVAGCKESMRRLHPYSGKVQTQHRSSHSHSPHRTLTNKLSHKEELC